MAATIVALTFTFPVAAQEMDHSKIKSWLHPRHERAEGRYGPVSQGLC